MMAQVGMCNVMSHNFFPVIYNGKISGFMKFGVCIIILFRGGGVDKIGGCLNFKGRLRNSNL